MFKEYKNGIEYIYPNKIEVARGKILGLDGNWTPKVIGAVHANYRHSKKQIIRGRTPLLIDGLLSGSFNKMGWDVWDKVNSKIIPQKADEIYHARINTNISSPQSVVISIELEIGGDIISQIRFQPMSLIKDFNSGLMQFYSSDRMVKNGAALYINPSNPNIDIECDVTSMHLVRFATTEAG